MTLHDRESIRDELLDSVFAGQDMRTAMPKYKFPSTEVPPQGAFQVVHDELMLDGNSRQNLATFCQTWEEPEVHALMELCVDKNMIDKDEYPQTAELELRCVNMLSRLWHAPAAEQAVGCSTTGSSEGCMLGGLALKRRWQKRRRAAGLPADRPNMVMGVNAQICWDKFMNYWDVEARLVPMEGDRYHLSAEEAVKLCDENTIGLVAIMGSTYDGSYEPVAETCRLLDELQQRTGIDVPVHVDGASGAMVAPFLDPGLEWDFRLPRVKSINTSGHKYGLVYPGVGWIVSEALVSVIENPDNGPAPALELHQVRRRISSGLNEEAYGLLTRNLRSTKPTYEALYLKAALEQEMGMIARARRTVRQMGKFAIHDTQKQFAAEVLRSL